MNDSVQCLIDYLLCQQSREIVVLTDSNLNELYPDYLDDLSQYFDLRKVVIPAGEKNKSVEQAMSIWQELLENEYDKSLTIINFGGGMICDLGGFVAATYKRGVHCVNYPTTLLAMIDAAHGGKTAVNLNYMKNCVGIIRQPDFVVPADVDLLRTLPELELLSGFGELIKYALISSRSFFDQLKSINRIAAETIQQSWITSCVNFKNKIVAIDPEDKRERQLLNFGHTFGHAVESLSAVEGSPIPHGIAVAHGMVYECLWAMREGFIKSKTYDEIAAMIGRFYQVPPLTDSLFDKLLPFILQDKKIVKKSNNRSLSELLRPFFELFDIENKMLF